MQILASFEIAVATAGIIAAAVLGLKASASSAELARLEVEAHAACLCDKAAASSAAGMNCWAALEKKVLARGGQMSATACAPISTSMACLGEECVATSYRYVGPGPRRLVLCDQDEARAIDRAYTATSKRTGDPEAAMREAQRVAEAIARGAAVRMAAAKPGCAG